MFQFSWCLGSHVLSSRVDLVASVPFFSLKFKQAANAWGYSMCVCMHVCVQCIGDSLKPMCKTLTHFFSVVTLIQTKQHPNELYHNHQQHYFHATYICLCSVHKHLGDNAVGQVFCILSVIADNWRSVADVWTKEKCILMLRCSNLK